MQYNYSYSAFARHTIQPQQRIAAEAWKESGKDKSSSMFTSVVLVWLYIIRFSFSKKASEEENLVLVLVS